MVIKVVYRRTHNAMAKRKRPNNDVRNNKDPKKIKDRATLTPLKTNAELMCSVKVGSFCSTCDTRRVTFVSTAVISDT